MSSRKKFMVVLLATLCMMFAVNVFAQSRMMIKSRMANRQLKLLQRGRQKPPGPSLP